MAQQYGRNVSLTSDLTTIDWGFRPTYIRIDASTANTAYLSFSTAVATTVSSGLSGSYQLTSGNPAPIEIRHLDANGMSSALTAIAAVTTTAVIRVLALRI